MRARDAGASRPPGPVAVGLVVLFLLRGKGKRLDRAGKAKVAEAISTNLADGRVVLDNVPWTLWASSSGSKALCLLCAASQLRRPIHRTTGRTSPATPPWPCGIVCQCRFGWRLNALVLYCCQVWPLPQMIGSSFLKTLQACWLIDLERHLFLPDLGIEF